MKSLSRSCTTSQPLKKSLFDDLPATSVNMASRGDDPRRSRRQRQGVPPLPLSPDFEYNPRLGQILIEREGVFQDTRSRVSISYSDQPSTSRGATSPGTMRHMF